MPPHPPRGPPLRLPRLRGEKFCYYHHAERKPVADVRLRQIVTTNLKDHQNSQASESTNASPAKQKCHPERSGGAAESKDLRLQNSDDSFDTKIFPKPQPQLRPITRATAATLLEALARHKGIDPQPGSPNDRKPSPEPTPETLSTLHAAHARGTNQPSPTAQKPSPNVKSAPQFRPVLR